ncbi:hypothetical protein CK623_11935 [Vandammella animalimorsus]|uniref:Uncharacterized protein n=1 Tax=Vandammella animalimorsus TaxID=2029117 RepID=A0A2A2AMM5_9BURK|nr:hypothetical protein CK623_11935 [Vandammella animalimorsus]
MAQAACKQPGQCTRHCRAGEENDAKQARAAASRLPGWGQGAKTAPGRELLRKPHPSAACSVQRAACSVQRAACSVQRAACSVQRAACSVQRAAFCGQFPGTHRGAIVVRCKKL